MAEIGVDMSHFPPMLIYLLGQVLVLEIMKVQGNDKVAESPSAINGSRAA